MSSRIAEEQPTAADAAKKAEDHLISKTSINKYDPYQLKCSLDDEIVAVCIPQATYPA